MQKKRLWQVAGPALVLVLVSLSTGQATEVSGQQEIRDVDVVWSESDGIRHEIFFSTRMGGAWSEPEMLTDDFYDNQAPVIDRSSDGTRWVFWSAYNNGAQEIRYTSGGPQSWADSAVVPSELNNNVTPSAIIDADGVVHVVWSANSGGSDDIYYASFQSGGWTEAQLVNPVNDVADVQPIIDLNEADMPVVSWRTFTDAGYVEVISELADNGWSATQYSQPNGEESGTDLEQAVELPAFLSERSILFLRLYQ